MAKVNGMKEKLHMPLYDAFFVPKTTPDIPFANRMTDPRVIRFFVDVQNKTRLETNLQAAGMLPSLNSYEARAMRVVTSGLNEAAIGDLIYNSVTTLLVGEKIMVESPTYMFPSGTGVSNGLGELPQHGDADPRAAFSFAEPSHIESQQNYRVEISFPHGVPGAVGGPAGTLGALKGPLRIWVVLDGYLTRDVQ